MVANFGIGTLVWFEIKVHDVIGRSAIVATPRFEWAMTGTGRGLLMKWVLVLMVLGHNGQALDHIRFTSQEVCEQVRSKFVEQSGAANIGVVAFCVHDEG